MKRTILALALCLALTLTPAMAAGVEDKFPAVNQYPGYADVPGGIWYEEYAKLSYETGLITGSAIGFEPERNMKMGEVAAISARIVEAVTGDAIPAPVPNPALPWYQHYVDYWERHGFSLTEDMEADATRQNFVGLLSAALPGDLLAPINAVTKLPDSDREDVLRLYNAGILTGTDKYGTFTGDKPLTRMEGAAMVSRVVRESLRMPFSPADYTPFTAAGLAPGDVLFAGGKTAGDYLPAVLALIDTLEAQCAKDGIAFNWFHTVGEQTFLVYVKETALSHLGVTEETGNESFRALDLQVFYSRYLDLKGAVA